MSKDNNYAIYRKIVPINEYFDTWKDKEQLDQPLREVIYSRYIIKSFCFQRDEFKCVNENCKTPLSQLTLHHVRFQKNGGKDSVRNCVTLCKTCHQAFHRCKIELTFGGMTYKVSKNQEVNWKIVKKQNKKLRKKIKREGISIVISESLFERLIRFMMIEFEGEEDDG